MKYSPIFLAAVLSPMLGTSLGAQEGQAPACGAFEVFGTIETRAFADVGDVGATGGDHRVGSYKLADEGGKELGVMHFSGVVMPKSESRGPMLMMTLHFAFANGSLAAISVVSLPRPGDIDVGPEEEFEYAVTGGTGDFTHASGTLVTRTAEDDRREMSFDVVCGV